MSECQDLIAKAKSVEDFDESSDALRLLGDRAPDLARQVALDILVSQIGDAYYQAGAFDVLFRISTPAAVVYIQSNSMSAEPYILGTMLSAIAEESGALQGRELIERAVKHLRNVIASRPECDLASIRDEVDYFLQTYGEYP